MLISPWLVLYTTQAGSTMLIFSMVGYGLFGYDVKDTDR